MVCLSPSAKKDRIGTHYAIKNMNGILSETMHFVDPFWDYRLKSDK